GAPGCPPRGLAGWLIDACSRADECRRKNPTTGSSGAGSLAIGGNDVWLGWRPGPATDIRLDSDHVDAVNRAGFYAEIAAGALAFNDGVHVFGGPENGIYRTGLDALGAANAFVFTNNRHSFGLFCAVFGIQWLGFNVQQVSQSLDGAFTAGRALVDGLAIGNCFSVGAAAGKSALPTLGLRKERIDLLNQRVALYLDPFRCKAQ